ncbi:MAG: carbamoyl-phosphate synthase large subunit [Nitrospirota bacterium]|nr:MAG: carbamoyl-phosphate synthase large subunit [Nitrospirota bacterium]
MPKRDDIKNILIIGSGPIVIGQACEFDYSGAQACKALREEGYRVILVNSNPATIMTDPEMADSTYVEPLTKEILELIIEKERPDAILPTMGGQTALNLAVELSEGGVLDKYGVELIGAKLPAIKKAEDRDLFRDAMYKIGLDLPVSAAVEKMDDGMDIIDKIGFPAILRPAFTLGGTGGAVAYNMEEYKVLLENALKLSPVSQVLVEESIIGWKEFELEVMRDNADNVVIICSIENFDQMGVHTGDSITVAPAQTLSDKEYQRMRDASIDIIREIGVDTGGSNIQFALNPEDGRMVVIEMNPRVSRSSALASKATGFPIAKIAAKLAIGLTLDEIKNDITRETPASFEPTIDYVVTKVPRFAFEKFPETDPTLTTQMKSVGEVMSIGRTFKESFQKAIRSLELDSYGLENRDCDDEELREKMKVPNSDRIWYVAEAIRRGMNIGEIYEITMIDPWFLNNMREIVEFEAIISEKGNRIMEDRDMLLKSKSMGFSDRRIAELVGVEEKDIRGARASAGMRGVYKMVDTCAAEFEAYTPYLYSTYEKPFRSILKGKKAQTPVTECESLPSERKKVMILGSGPNRIGQGIEFDYCCVHAVFSLKEEDFETIMVNCNPETVSTDYDTSDRLYFEPLTLEDVMNIIEVERPEGVIVQFGGQTPLKLAVPLEKEGVKILGTPPDAIDRAEDRKRFKDLLHKLGLKQPDSGTAMSSDEAVSVASEIGYPCMVRPSYVLGGRAMEIVYDEASLIDYMQRAVKASPEHPVLVDKYIVDATEVDVDALSDEDDVIIGGVMEHIEAAGVHSGDSACSIPPYSLGTPVVEEIKKQARELAMELGVIGLMNVQFAVKDNDIYILEVNPRASRTIPYVSKATGIPLAKMAAKVMAGRKLKDLGLVNDPVIEHIAVKEAVFPFDRFSNVDTILGPEMKSTGEVMGIDADFGIAYAKAESSARNQLPMEGKIFISVRNEDKPNIPEIARTFIGHGFDLVATRGTAAFLMENGIETQIIKKLKEGRPNVVDMIKNQEISFIINTIESASAQADSFYIRQSALQYRVSYTTTMSGARAVAKAIDRLKNNKLTVKSLQEYHSDLR